MPSTSDRRRKISLQNDYAYCIISPVSPSVVPIKITPAFNQVGEKHKYDHHFLDETSHNEHDLEVADEAYLSLDTKSNNAIGSFRRWSFCNYQISGLPISPCVTEATALDFGDNNDGYGFKLLASPDKNVSPNSQSGLSSASSSSTSLNWLSGIVSNIPERIRKFSTEKNKFDAKSMQKDEEIRDQMKKLVVY